MTWIRKRTREGRENGAETFMLCFYMCSFHVIVMTFDSPTSRRSRKTFTFSRNATVQHVATMVTPGRFQLSLTDREEFPDPLPPPLPAKEKHLRKTFLSNAVLRSEEEGGRWLGRPHVISLTPASRRAYVREATRKHPAVGGRQGRHRMGIKTDDHTHYNCRMQTLFCNNSCTNTFIIHKFKEYQYLLHCQTSSKQAGPPSYTNLTENIPGEILLGPVHVRQPGDASGSRFSLAGLPAHPLSSSPHTLTLNITLTLTPKHYP